MIRPAIPMACGVVHNRNYVQIRCPICRGTVSPEHVLAELKVLAAAKKLLEANE